MDTLVVNEQLENLSLVAERLRVSTDELHDKFRQIEESINKMGLGVTAWADTLIGVNKNQNSAYKVGYCRIGRGKNKVWGFCLRSVTIDNDGNECPDQRNGYGLLLPISNITRALRVEASEVIDEIIMHLISKAELFLNDVKYAHQNLDDIDISRGINTQCQKS